ncbi:MAG: DUF3460 family protein [Betaproteobacteria bacterium]|nr:DUF3460 family protein [Betaproteobacteria bacterium]
MNDLMEKNPHWRAEQKAGRALWWDKKQTTDETAAHAASRVAQKPYPYDVNFYGDHGE